MKTCNVRFLLFSLLVLVAVAGPGVPKVPVRGVGCGGARGAVGCARASRAVPLAKATSIPPLKSVTELRPIKLPPVRSTGAPVAGMSVVRGVPLAAAGETELAAATTRDVVIVAPLDAGGTASREPPRSLLPASLLLPEPPVSSYRPPPQEPFGPGLPPVEAETVAPVAKAPPATSKGGESGLLAQVLAHAANLSKGGGTSGKVAAPEKRQGKQKVDQSQSGVVARLLKRPLTPPERILVQVMKQQGKKPEEMARILEELPPRRSPKKGP